MKRIRVCMRGNSGCMEWDECVGNLLAINDPNQTKRHTNNIFNVGNLLPVLSIHVNVENGN